MAQRSVFSVLNRSVSKLNGMLESTDVGVNGVNLADIEEVVNDLTDVQTALNRLKEALCAED